MSEALDVKVTRKNPMIPLLLKLLSREQIGKSLKRPTQKAAVYVAKNKLSGQVLHVRTGNLRRSILQSVKVRGFVASLGTPLKYGRVHEEGMTIYPKNGKYLTFKGAGGWVSMKSVKIPKRPWLAPGTEEYVKSGEFLRLFKLELLKELYR